jgi:hypothetical protein
VFEFRADRDACPVTFSPLSTSLPQKTRHRSGTAENGKGGRRTADQSITHSDGTATASRTLPGLNGKFRTGAVEAVNDK